ncbi:MAG: oxygen-independent coproporphyrinogen III oxidase [Hyphomicrobiaceae bacterium]|nr:oxygen-independent coproporphyrinogen III oxidase [Hyphomicrobiaceae bacterium]
MVQNADRYATLAVPRYTSYPTAPHFTGAIGPDTARRWLSEIAPGTPLSLYLHIPFCRSMCAYCGCHTKVTRSDEPIVDYARHLALEIALVSGLMAEGQTVSAIHWGGGTPSLVPPESLRMLRRRLDMSFAMAPDMEHAMELDPRTVEDGLADVLAEIGINRASLGVQDIDPTVQEAIGRPQPLEVVAEAAGALRRAGITAINMDLMYGLPLQGIAEVVRSVEAVADLGATRVALFGYAHVPWFKKHQRLIDEAALPGTQERQEQVDAAGERLRALGYEPIGFDHFALPDDPMAVAAREGTLKRNFQGYTTDDAPALIGLGASSIGKLPQGYLQNAPEPRAWKRSIISGEPATLRGHAFIGDDRARADAIEALLTGFAADLGAVARAHGLAPTHFDADLQGLDDLVADGLAERDGRRVTIPLEARPFARIVAARFDSYLKASEARHSVAV